MGELRWILLGLGIVALVLIYAFSRYRIRPPAKLARQARERVEPSLRAGTGDSTDGELPPEPPAGEETPPAPAPVEKVVAIRLMSKDKMGFPGDKLVLTMRGAGLRHGRFGIFHAHDGDSDTVLFSVASLVEPGTFDLASLAESRLPGVSLFLVLPAAGDSMAAFEAMIDTARALAGSLDGELLDEQGSSLSVQRERYIRDEIQQFVREHLTVASAAGSEV